MAPVALLEHKASYREFGKAELHALVFSIRYQGGCRFRFVVGGIDFELYVYCYLPGPLLPGDVWNDMAMHLPLSIECSRLSLSIVFCLITYVKRAGAASMYQQGAGSHSGQACHFRLKPPTLSIQRAASIKSLDHMVSLSVWVLRGTRDGHHPERVESRCFRGTVLQIGLTNADRILLCMATRSIPCYPCQEGPLSQPL